MSSQVCKNCSIEKHIDLFRFIYNNKNPLKICRECENLQARQKRAKKDLKAGRPRKYTTEEERRKAGIEQAIRWRTENRERYMENERKRRIKRKDKQSVIQKRYVENNREKVNKSRRGGSLKRKARDPIFKFKEAVKSTIRGSFNRRNKKFEKRKRSEEILGCSIEFFIEYILLKCPEGVGIKDFGRYGYHIDHIIPISTAKTEEDVIKLCHYMNLQPLWHEENIKKSNKLL